MFISLPQKNSDIHNRISDAQEFHFDSDFSRFLKLYIYLTDVDMENGPHVYVEKTHIYKNKKHQLTKGLSDKQINSNYKTIKTITGKHGTLFFEDSFGFHKGNVPNKKHRIMLNIHFGNSKLKYSEYDIFQKYPKSTSQIYQ